MSEFVAGFAPIHAAADILARAFSAPTGFAPAAPANIPAPTARPFAAEGMGSRPDPSAEAGPRHFRPADPDANPTEGWDPFDCEPAADLIDPVAAARAAGYAEGLAAAMAEVEAGDLRDRQLIARLAEGLAQAGHIDRDAVARRLRQTVLALVERLVGEVGVSANRMTARIDAAADLLADGLEAAILRMHPEDVALVEGKLPKGVFPIGDAGMERGGFVLEAAETIVEDAPSLWLDQLGAAIDRVQVPVAC